MAFAIEELVNQAARQAGIRRRIGSIYDGSELAKVALDVYGQTRDELLRRQSWGFAQRQSGLLVVSAFAPPLPWLYAYDWPTDALLICAVLPFPITYPDLNPVDYLFAPYNLVSGSPVMDTDRVVVSYVANAFAIYTGRITNPNQWDAGFTAAMIANLQEKLAPALAAAANADMAALTAGKAARAESIAVGSSELQPPMDAPMPAAPARGAAS